MQRYFSNIKEDDMYLLSNDDNYHITKVMRMNINDKIEIVDNKITYICEIVNLNPVKAKVIEKLKENNECEKKVIVVQSLVSENKMDLILQKGCELGFYKFYAYKATNSIIKENDKTDKKMIRWQKIVKEASEQSKRNIIPKVEGIIDINELCELKADLKILLSVNEVSMSMKKVLQTKRNYDTLIIVVGPEGGFTSDEEIKLIENGYERVSLGKKALRTETASLAALSMINYEWMV